MYGRKLLHTCLGQLAFLALGHNGSGQGVLRGSLQAGSQGEQPLLVHVLSRQNVGDHRLSPGEGTRLIQHDCVHRVELLQGLGRLD